ncbi:PREDICTED: S-adenosylmethionine mitochondrial carrier protein-like [Apaloderma vittatum]|uniref:S-adenosylmethionine mitochondrial carrier protein-like n=1 Tax=Apaloderma vittatum TaxID=57397 RepID=UPI000521AB84|nr:PREDICTED: S-adenosylmethionine mitochondrial carrier protein-like [Apaloderma vittatum]
MCDLRHVALACSLSVVRRNLDQRPASPLGPVTLIPPDFLWDDVFAPCFSRSSACSGLELWVNRRNQKWKEMHEVISSCPCQRKIIPHSTVDLWSWKQGHVVDSWQSAVCGAFAGGFAAAVTTPLDVAKTRIMLAKAGSSNASGNVLTALRGIWRTQGLSGLFAGVVPRMAAISLGGFIFLGTYEKTRQLLL